jgi:hypothetical protein
MKKSIFCITIVILFVFSLFNLSSYVHADAIPAVIEQNISKMDKVSDHGAEFVVDYISESWDYETVENILGQIKSLSDELCAGCVNDYDKICILADYVSSNIAYDFDAKHNAVTFDVISLENVLQKKRTTCAGFSNLFSALCNAQGLYCVNIRGSAVSSEDGVYADSLDDENTVMNHEWTAVYYNDEQRWVYVDCTWNSTNTYKNGEFFYSSAPRTKYLDISIENLSQDHKAIIVEHREFFDALTILEKPSETTLIPESHDADYENSEITEFYLENTEEQNNQNIIITDDIQQTETNLISNTQTVSGYTSSAGTTPESSDSSISSLNTSNSETNSDITSSTIYDEDVTQRKKGNTLIVEDNPESDSPVFYSYISDEDNKLIFIVFIPIIIVILIILKVMSKKL